MTPSISSGSLTAGSLFTGIGGFDLGFQRAGVRTSWMCERDAACQSVLRKHWPGVQIYDDVRSVGRDAEPIDILMGGFPCQDVSIAGRRAGLAGERSGLWFEFHRILGELAPQWVVIENVPGLLSSNGGRDFAAILRGLVELGYGVVWRILDSQHFGVPQRRRRVYLVGHLGTGRAAQVLFERESGAGNSEPGGPARQAVTASPEGIAGTVSSKWAKGSGGPAGDEAYNLIVFDWQAGGDTMSASDRLSPSLVVGRTLAVTSPPSVSVDFRHSTLDGVTPTLQAKGQGGYSLNMLPGVLHPTDPRPRRLTPLECERLQAFPDGWTAGQSDSARYRQMGNAVTVSVAEWIARRIAEAAQS